MCTWVASFILFNEISVTYPRNKNKDAFTHVYSYNYKFYWSISNVLWSSCRQAHLNMCTASNLASIDLKVIMKREQMYQRWGSQVIAPTNQELFEFFLWKTLQCNWKTQWNICCIWNNFYVPYSWKNCHLVATTVIHKGPIMALVF